MQSLYVWLAVRRTCTNPPSMPLHRTHGTQPIQLNVYWGMCHDVHHGTDADVERERNNVSCVTNVHSCVVAYKTVTLLLPFGASAALLHLMMFSYANGISHDFGSNYLSG